MESARAALSAEDAAEYLGGGAITAKTMQGLVRRREIGFVRIGRVTVFPLAALDEYLQSHLQRPEPKPWGLAESSLRRIREGTPSDRVQRRSELMKRRGGRA